MGQSGLGRSFKGAQPMSDDNVVQMKAATPCRGHNEDILTRMRGVEAFTVTPVLRWNNGVLEQLHRGTTSGDVRWEPIPDASEIPF